jgi:hypothetical protein
LIAAAREEQSEAQSFHGKQQYIHTETLVHPAKCPGLKRSGLWRAGGTLRQLFLPAQENGKPFGSVRARAQPTMRFRTLAGT